MLSIDKGGEYMAYRVRSGSSETGPWEVISVKEDGGAHREISMFSVHVPSGVRENTMFKVNEITRIRMKRQRDSSGNWLNIDKPIIEADVTPLAEMKDIMDSLGVDDYYGDLM